MRKTTLLPSRNDGFTLIELLVAFSVLAIAGVGLFYVATTSTTSNLKSLNQAAAMELAVDKIEELRNTAFDDIASGADSTTITTGGDDGGIYTRSWTVSSRTIGASSAKDITVTVGWTGGGDISLITTVVETNQIIPVPFMTAFSTAFVRTWNHSR